MQQKFVQIILCYNLVLILLQLRNSVGTILGTFDLSPHGVIAFDLLIDRYPNAHPIAASITPGVVWNCLNFIAIAHVGGETEYWFV